MRAHLRNNLIFLIVSLVAFLEEPALVSAQIQDMRPVNFTEALNLSRGSLSPASPDASYFTYEDTCTLVEQEWGWTPGSCDYIDKIVINHGEGIDTLVVEKPNSDGYVKLDDWETGDRDEQIGAIWRELEESAKQQSSRLSQSIVPKEWYVYPTLNKNKSYMYYATLVSWNGEPTINVKASLFDRKGYIAFRIIPVDSTISPVNLERMVEGTLQSYLSEPNESYFSFQSGDKVAAVGALGVLASLVGVKYGKAAASGLMAALLLIAKKFWFVLLLPLIFLKNLVFRKLSAGDFLNSGRTSNITPATPHSRDHTGSPRRSAPAEADPARGPRTPGRPQPHPSERSRASAIS